MRCCLRTCGRHTIQRFEPQHARVHKFIHVHKFTYMYVRLHICTYVYIHVRAFTYMCVRLHTHNTLWFPCTQPQVFSVVTCLAACAISAARWSPKNHSRNIGSNAKSVVNSRVHYGRVIFQPELFSSYGQKSCWSAWVCVYAHCMCTAYRMCGLLGSIIQN